MYKSLEMLCNFAFTILFHTFPSLSILDGTWQRINMYNFIVDSIRNLKTPSLSFQAKKIIISQSFLAFKHNGR